MHCRPTLGPRRVDLLVITADEFVVGVAAEDRLQLLRLLSAERRLGADSEEGVQEERELQRRVVLLLLRQLWRLLKGFRGGARRPQQSREGGGVVLLRQRRRLRLLIAEAAVEAELQKRI